jgi:cytochrome c oxidase assembly protein subunit 15
MARASLRSAELDSPWPHRLALLTTIATLPLLFIGGLVTSTGAGLAVPDWPTTFGYNMFLYPWAKMVGGIFYEHSHRLVGSLVGFLTILLAGALWFRESRRWLCWLGVIALGAVIVQGILGGLRVVLLQQTLAIVHACFAQAFFVLVASITLFTSAEWREPIVKKTAEDTSRVQHLGLVTCGLLYLQIILGALLRHTGEWADLHMAGAALATLHILVLASRIQRNHVDLVALARPATFLRALLMVQLGLGFGAYLGKFTAMGFFLNPFVVAFATSHVVVGALMLVTCVVLTLRAYRTLATEPPTAVSQRRPDQIPAVQSPSR